MQKWEWVDPHQRGIKMRVFRNRDTVFEDLEPGSRMYVQGGIGRCSYTSHHYSLLPTMVDGILYREELI